MFTRSDSLMAQHVGTPGISHVGSIDLRVGPVISTSIPEWWYPRGVTDIDKKFFEKKVFDDGTRHA